MMLMPSQVDSPDRIKDLLKYITSEIRVNYGLKPKNPGALIRINSLITGPYEPFNGQDTIFGPQVRG